MGIWDLYVEAIPERAESQFNAISRGGLKYCDSTNPSGKVMHLSNTWYNMYTIH